MNYNINGDNLIILRNIKLPFDASKEDLFKKVKNLIKKDDFSYSIYKRSLDARDGIFYVYQVLVDTDVSPQIFNKLKNNISYYNEEKLILNNKNKVKSALVVGAGPAGLFCAYTLLKAGVGVKIIERGDDIDTRMEKIKNLMQNSILDENSNISFGEGGAGTFSDGKLTSRSKDKRSRKIFEILVDHGAPSDILYDAMPHIGTDVLRKVIKNIRKSILKMGGEFYFRTKFIDLKFEDGKVKSLITDRGEFEACQYILALGNSSRDTFSFLNKYISLEAKPFALGFRIEHLQSDINFSQYKIKNESLPQASYALTYSKKENPHSAYTFCMCPGGYVVPSSTEKNRLCVNGMSEHKRNGINANSALVCTVSPDFYGNSPLGGIDFQRKIEERAFILGGGKYFAPVQKVCDFLADKESTSLGKIIPTYKPGYKLTSLNDIYSPSINKVLKEAILSMDKKLHGFANNDAILTGVETRTSSPVRILRKDYHTLEYNNLRPIGEGAGFAGGIVSSALDGLKCAIEILEG